MHKDCSNQSRLENEREREKMFVRMNKRTQFNLMSSLKLMVSHHQKTTQEEKQ